MHLAICLVLTLGAVVSAGASAAETQATQAARLDASIDTLTGVVERLADALEREAAFRASEEEARRVEVAVAILEMRNRKIDILEGAIRDIVSEEQDLQDQIDMMRAEIERLESEGRDDAGQLTAETRQMIEQYEAPIRLQGERIARLRDRSLVLQNDLTSERRRLASVESIVEAWMEKQ